MEMKNKIFGGVKIIMSQLGMKGKKERKKKEVLREEKESPIESCGNGMERGRGRGTGSRKTILLT